MDAQNKSGFDNGTTLMFQGIGVYLHRYGQTDGCTVSHMTTKLVIDVTRFSRIWSSTHVPLACCSFAINAMLR